MRKQNKHKNSRKACVGPGFCSDPDLEWLLLQKDRKIKAWNTRHTKRKKIIRYVFYAAWIFILIQGVLEIPEHGAWVPFSVWGYGATQTFSFGLINGFRDLLISRLNALELLITLLLFFSSQFNTTAVYSGAYRCPLVCELALILL